MDELCVEARVKAHFPTPFIPNSKGELAEKPLELQEALMPPAEFKRIQEQRERQLIVAETTGSPEYLPTEDQLVLAAARYDAVKESLDARSYTREAMAAEVERAEQAAVLTSRVSAARVRVVTEQKAHDTKRLEDAYKHRDDSEAAMRKFLDLSKKSTAAMVLDHEHSVAGRHAQLKALAAQSKAVQNNRVSQEQVQQEQLLLAELKGKEDLQLRRDETARFRQQLEVSREVSQLGQERQAAQDAAKAIRIEARCTHQLSSLITDLEIEYGASCPKEVLLGSLKASLTAQLEAVEADLQSTLLVKARATMVANTIQLTDPAAPESAELKTKQPSLLLE